MTRAAAKLKALGEASPDLPSPPRWLLLFHQLPPKPSYVRVKIWRRLQALGAVPVKNSVYALPRSEQSFEDFQWVLREIATHKGEGSVCEARFIDGLTDDQIEQLFIEARDADYQAVADEARHAIAKLEAKRLNDKEIAAIKTQSGRLARRLAEVIAIDFCDAPNRQSATGLVDDLGRKLATRKAKGGGRVEPITSKAKPVRGATWVTRTGVHIDRIASAWLIRRFIDPEAKLKFVPAKGYQPEAGELRFDMFEAEFTHVGDLCTFEVLLRRFGLDDAGLRAIAEIVHDIDLKDAKFGRPETAGVQNIVNGIAKSTREDELRIALASPIFEGLHTQLRPTRDASVKTKSGRR